MGLIKIGELTSREGQLEVHLTKKGVRGTFKNGDNKTSMTLTCHDPLEVITRFVGLFGDFSWTGVLSFGSREVNVSYLKGMVTYKVKSGYHFLTPDGSIRYEGDYTGNGFCYKNLDAWRSGKGVIYVGEYALEEQDKDVLWTRAEWVEWVKDYIRHIAPTFTDNGIDVEEVINDKTFIDGIAYIVLFNADWADLSTVLEEFEQGEEWVLNQWCEYKGIE